jgi:3-deoxy-manno-octulosonate cytidylyltransferase (CMP-KDO synthetase)
MVYNEASMSAIVVIPARYASTRFPGKPLSLLKGRPLIQHVYENCRLSRLAEKVVVATDDGSILKAVRSFGGEALMTSARHASGTDRIAEIAEGEACDIIVNVQGDEPLIRPEMIDDAISALSDSRASIGTLAKKIAVGSEVFDPNVVKVAFDAEGFALYFSRSPIPYHRDLFGTQPLWGDRADRLAAAVPDLVMFKHVGIYSYRRDVLLRLSLLPPSRLEEIECLEQLRALENGFRIKVLETEFETIGVDTPADLERIENA